MLVRFLTWFLRVIGSKTLIGGTLLLIAIGSAAYGLADIVKGLDAAFLMRLVFWGITTSWLLARTRIRGWFAAIFLILLGVIVLWIDVGDLFSPIITLFRATDYLVWEFLHRVPDTPIDLTNFNVAYAELYYAIAAMIAALWDWILSIAERLPVYNEIAITLVWGSVMWIVAAWAGWVLRRHNQPLLGVLPSGILLSATLAYSWSGTAPLAPMLFATLLLMAMGNYTKSESSWIESKMDYPEDLPKEFGYTTMGMVVGIVALAIFLPIFSIQNIVNFAHTFSQSQIEGAQPVIQSFGLLQSSLPQEDIGNALRGGFPRGHLMGSGPELSEQLVMTIKITAGIPDIEARSLALPLYWRSLTYDEYTGFGWKSTDIVLHSYKAGQQVLSTDSPFHKVIQQDFRMTGGETRFLYAAGDILSADDDFKIAYRPTLRYTEVLDAHGDFFGASIDKSAYRVQSMIPVVTEADLRSTLGDYPTWIEERYLPLPDSIPTRVFDLAREITQVDSTPYDQARSLEQYLRGFEYTLDVDMPPLRQDMVDYFLFDLHKGYCDYYATSMVVMARGLGIPARLAIGYYRGTYDDVNHRYIITEADAHSWVEVYFPQVGWIPFEPTAGRAAIERFQLESEFPSDSEYVRPISSLTSWFYRLDWNWKLVTSLVLGSIMLVVLGFIIIENLRFQRFTPAKTLTYLYQRLYRYGRALNAGAERGDTPLEFSHTLIDRVTSLSRGSRLAKVLSPASQEIDEFTRVYTRMLYSPVFLKIDDRKWAIAMWRRLRRRLWLARMRQLFARKPTKVQSSHTE
jgi:transglutaminase-like putative cysteine protease